MAKPKRTFEAVCDRCYTCVLYSGPSIRAAERVATSHINTYGHNVTILRPADVPAAGQTGDHNGNL
jgi:hypothetical protein